MSNSEDNQGLYYFDQVHSDFPSIYANNFNVMKMCAAFSEVGLQTKLVVSRTKKTAARLENLNGSLWDFYGAKNNFEIEWMRFGYSLPRLRRSLHALYAVVYAIRNRVKLVYTRSEWIALFFNLLGIRTCLELHQWNGDISQRLLLLFSKKLFKKSGIVCISHNLARTLKENGLLVSLLFVAHDAVDLGRFGNPITKSDARSELKLPDNRKIVGYAGSLYEGRGVDVILKAAKKTPDVCFFIVGGNDNDILMWKSRAREMSVDNVRFVGFVRHSMLPVYLFAADVLVMPHTEDCDIIEFTSPMKMFEYMASGRPIIASDFPVFREVLMHEKNALLVKPSDHNELASAMKRLLNDSVLTDKLAQQALLDVQNFTWEKRASNIFEFMKKRAS